MARVTWVDCVLDAVAFEGAELLRCSWVQSVCERPADWTRARLTTCCVVLTDLGEAVFAGATLHESSLRNIGLAGADFTGAQLQRRSEEQPSELQSLMRISYAVFCLK